MFPPVLSCLSRAPCDCPPGRPLAQGLARRLGILLPGSLVVTLVVTLLAGCTAAGAYKPAPGPFAVLVTEPVTVTDPAQPRDIPVRVAAPAGPGPYPVVVFSHGARCYPQGYGPVIEHWVSHGYVVLLPDHLDSPNNTVPPTPDQAARLLASRLRDMAFVADEVPRILALAGLAGRGDPGRMAVAGHSFGALMALAAAGLPLDLPTGSPAGGFPGRPRAPVSAAVIMSGVGPMVELGADTDAFASLTVPLMATGGTLDVGNTGGPTIRPWEWRMSAYTLSPPGNKYSVVLEEGDHYLGGLICRSDRGGAPDAEGARIDAALTLAFLDAFLKGDAGARRFLDTSDVSTLTGGRARFERK